LSSFADDLLSADARRSMSSLLWISSRNRARSGDSGNSAEMSLRRDAALQQRLVDARHLLAGAVEVDDEFLEKPLGNWIRTPLIRDNGGAA